MAKTVAPNSFSVCCFVRYREGLFLTNGAGNVCIHVVCFEWVLYLFLTDNWKQMVFRFLITAKPMFVQGVITGFPTFALFSFSFTISGFLNTCFGLSSLVLHLLFLHSATVNCYIETHLPAFCTMDCIKDFNMRETALLFEALIKTSHLPSRPRCSFSALWLRSGMVVCVVSNWWLNTSEKPFHFLVKALCFHCTPQPGCIKAITVYLSAKHTHTTALCPNPSPLPAKRKRRNVLKCYNLENTTLISCMPVFDVCPHCVCVCAECSFLIVFYSNCFPAWYPNAIYTGIRQHLLEKRSHCVREIYKR